MYVALSEYHFFLYQIVRQTIIAKNSEVAERIPSSSITCTKEVGLISIALTVPTLKMTVQNVKKKSQI
jgi:hypothetical protein